MAEVLTLTQRAFENRLASAIKLATARKSKVTRIQFSPTDAKGVSVVTFDTIPPIDLAAFTFRFPRHDPVAAAERTAVWNSPEEQARIRALPAPATAAVLALIERRMLARARSVHPIPRRTPMATIFGYTPEQLRDHLEARFVDGMSWGNIAYWHIDHIRPLASFDLYSIRSPDFAKAWALSNLQPLWGRDNSKKGARWQP